MQNQFPYIRLSEGSLMAADDFLNSMLNSLHDYAIFTVDPNLVINYWSMGATRQLGYEASEVIGQSIHIIYTGSDCDHGVPLQDRKTALQEGKAMGNRWYLIKDGSRFFASALLYPILDQVGRLLGFVKILKDITHRKIAEDAIRNNVNELVDLVIHKENTLSLLSQHHRSPLSTIIEITNYLQSDIDNMNLEDVKHILALLYHSSTQELIMLDHLVECARIKHASDIFAPTTLPLKEVVDVVIETFYKHLEIKCIRVDNEIAETTCVFADKMMIASVFQSLISNAVKYTGVGGNITISAVTDSGKVMVIVKDTGTGMSGEQLTQLFNPHFYSLTDPGAPERRDGFSLFPIKRFIDKNKGEIYAESVQGIGTTFYITLPIEDVSLRPAIVSEDEFME